MEDVLHAVDHDGLTGVFDDVDDALDAQQVVAAHPGDHFKPGLQAGP
ncbi:Uncharacterised protein [Mycobacteroides abscessus subsp. abscessus]|nr:Uncharacterised protein [Mycobacteroides abscessus subsp. abscessus]